MRRAIGLLRGLIPLALALVAGVVIAHPANVSEAEDSLPTVKPMGRALETISVPVETPTAASAVELDYRPDPKATAAPKAKPAAPKSDAPGSSAAKPAPSQQAPKAAAPSNDAGAFSITCYAINGGTASGNPTGPGVAAADTSILKMGTKIRIDGVGDYTVLDRGPRGRTIDVWKPTVDECRAFGRKTRNVTIIG